MKVWAVLFSLLFLFPEKTQSQSHHPNWKFGGNLGLSVWNLHTYNRSLTNPGCFHRSFEALYKQRLILGLDLGLGLSFSKDTIWVKDQIIYDKKTYFINSTTGLDVGILIGNLQRKTHLLYTSGIHYHDLSHYYLKYELPPWFAMYFVCVSQDLIFDVNWTGIGAKGRKAEIHPAFSYIRFKAGIEYVVMSKIYDDSKRIPIVRFAIGVAGWSH